MHVSRRAFTGSACLAVLGGCTAHLFQEDVVAADLYGLIGEMKAAPGKRAEFVGYLREGTAAMPGNLAYIIAEDLEDDDTIWITEVWRSKADHAASLELPEVQAAIAKARPILAGFGLSREVRPIGWPR